MVHLNLQPATRTARRNHLIRKLVLAHLTKPVLRVAIIATFSWKMSIRGLLTTRYARQTVFQIGIPYSNSLSGSLPITQPELAEPRYVQVDTQKTTRFLRRISVSPRSRARMCSDSLPTYHHVQRRLSDSWVYHYRFSLFPQKICSETSFNSVQSRFWVTNNWLLPQEFKPLGLDDLLTEGEG